MKFLTMATLALLLVALTPNVAHAYLDPGTGSQVFQILIAIFVGGAFTLKMYWRRITEYFRPDTENPDE
ncbi:MAG: hypothetical protein ACLFS8_06530 [Clostridia bacterium]